MSAIGRIFLILNLVLAAVFLGFAANQLSQNTNVSESLRNERSAHEATKTTLNGTVSTLNTQVSQLKNDTSTLRDDRDQQKATSERNAQDLNHEKEVNAQLRGELTGIKESLNGYNTTIASLTTQKDTLVKEKEDAFAARDKAESEKTAADTARREAELGITKANANIADLEVAKTSAEKKAKSLDSELQQLYTVTKQPRIGTPQALVEGSVLSVDTSIAPGLLAINKGSNDKVVRGTVFDVYSGSTYKGRAKVEVVHDGYCSALIILQAKGTQISQGDRVTTQL
ncbi:MAG: hypothetical protein ABI054_03875 [Planctomycetota bacterium]